MCYHINSEEKNPKYLIISVIRTRCRHIGTDKEYTNEYPKQAPELSDTELGFLNSSNDIISGELDGILPDHDKVSGEIYPEKKTNESYMEIIEDDGKDTKEDENSKSDVC